jgi:hypothetical protein
MTKLHLAFGIKLSIDLTLLLNTSHFFDDMVVYAPIRLLILRIFLPHWPICIVVPGHRFDNLHF